MANRLLLNSIQYGIKIQTRGVVVPPSKVGAREVVGYGYNGLPTYIDRVDYPMPAVRYKEDTPDIVALKEKEKGDWKKLSIEEKKALYRASFCRTFSEMNAPTGEWKTYIGSTLFFVSLGIWFYMFCKYFIYPELPETFSKEHKLAQLKRMQLLGINPITGKWTKPVE